MTSLDVDEYLVPTGKWSNLRQWLEHVTLNERYTKILSFYQTRALPNVNLLLPYDGTPTSACKVNDNEDILNCLMKVSCNV